MRLIERIFSLCVGELLLLLEMMLRRCFTLLSTRQIQQRK
jgi:hypothetical protein